MTATDALTEREREILRLLANGLSDSEIADSLFLTVGTVKWYNRQIYSKLGVRSRTQAIAHADDRLTAAQKPPTTPQPAPSMSLPAQVTSFIGREREMGEIEPLLKSARLVTLSGPPGTGKTRLSVEVSNMVANDYPHGVVFVPLAPLRDPAHVVSAIAQALQVKEGIDSVHTALLGAIKTRHMLLILDNFEHVIEAAPLVSELLSAAPKLSILITSRETLRLYGEHEYPVPPLGLPDLRQMTNPSALSDYEAVELFVQRAQAAASGFALDMDNAAAVATICVHLDGLPLAIELAAARVKFYAPQTLLVRLSSRLEALNEGPRDLPVRQQTLRATLAWSYDLLDDDEKTLFARLGVFAGGFTREDAEAVCGGLDSAVTTGLESLFNKSLLRLERQSQAEPSYVMLETMREYALEKLDERGERDIICARHAQHYLQLAEMAAKSASGSREQHWLERLETQQDNLRAALHWSIAADPSAQISLKLIGNLGRFWEIRGHFNEGREWLEQVSELPGATAPTQNRADALDAVAGLTYLQCDYATTQALLEEALAIYRALGESVKTAMTLVSLGEVATEIGDYDVAMSQFMDVYAMIPTLGDQYATARALTQLGYGVLRMGDLSRGRAWLEEGIVIYRAINDQPGTALALAGLGEIAIRQERLGDAVELLETSLRVRRQLEHRWGIAASLGSLAWAEILQNHFDSAANLLTESLLIRQEINDPGGMAWCMEKFAEIALVREDFERAAVIYGAAAALRAPVSSVIDPSDQPAYEARVRRIRETLGEESLSAAWARGQAMSVAQMIDMVLPD